MQPLYLTPQSSMSRLHEDVHPSMWVITEAYDKGSVYFTAKMLAEMK